MLDVHKICGFLVQVFHAFRVSSRSNVLVKVITFCVMFNWRTPNNHLLIIYQICFVACLGWPHISADHHSRETQSVRVFKHPQ